jgi:hypothetical protein
MKLFLISQTTNNNYDTFDSAIVAAESEDEARNTHPSGGNIEEEGDYNAWATKAADVTVKYIGEAAPEIAKGVICASFNAG